MSHDHHGDQAMHMAVTTTTESVTSTMSEINHSGMDHNGMGHSMDPSDVSHDGMDHGAMTGMDHMMKMYFHCGYDEVILFKGWTISTPGGLVSSMIGIFLMAVLYEGLKYYREWLFRKSYAAFNFSCINSPGDGPKVMPNPHGNFRSRMLSGSHVVQTMLHVLQVTLSYFLMLIFMTYNVWLCIAVVLGAGVGFFVFGWKKAIVVDVTEHCH